MQAMLHRVAEPACVGTTRLATLVYCKHYAKARRVSCAL